MKFSTRAIAAAAVLVTTMGGLAACGRSTGPSAEVSAAAAKPVSDGAATGTITVWAMGDEGDDLKNVLGDFQRANPDAKVEITAVPWGSAYTKISAAVAANQLPDVIQVGTTWMGEWSSAKAFDPVPADYVKATDYYDGPWQTVVSNDTAYGVPWNTDPKAFVYRKDFADKLGLKPPTTWDELTAFTKTMQSSGSAKYGIYLQPSGEGTWQSMVPFGFQAGGTVLSEDGTTFAFDSPGWTEGLTYYNSLFQSGVAEPRKLVSGQEDVSAFVKGDIASFVAAPYVVRSALEQGGKDFADKVGVAVVPAKDSSSKPVSLVGGSDLVVSAKSQNRDSAWKLVKYLGSADVQTEWYKQAGSTPANKAAWTSEVNADPIVAAYGKGLENAQTVPSIPTWAQVAGVFDTETEKVTSGKSSPADALKTLQSQSQSIGTGK